MSTTLINGVPILDLTVLALSVRRLNWATVAPLPAFTVGGSGTPEDPYQYIGTANGQLEIDGDFPENNTCGMVKDELDFTYNAIVVVTDKGGAFGRWIITVAPNVIAAPSEPLVTPFPAAIGTLYYIADGDENGGEWFRVMIASETMGAAPTVFSHVPTSGDSGTYEPGVTAGANIAGVTTGKAWWTRIGAVLRIVGTITIDPTAPATPSAVLIGLPFNTNDFAADNEALGVAKSLSAGLDGTVAARNGTKTLKLEFTTLVDVSAHEWTYDVTCDVV